MQLSLKQKSILRLSGWNDEQIDNASFRDFDDAWDYIGDVIASFYAKQQRAMIKAWEEVDSDIANAFKREYGSPFAN